ncbi:MAG: D-alanyl-D-alanine carboxypeptidase family protein, partial [Pseudomonadota bacterium]
DVEAKSKKSKSRAKHVISKPYNPRNASILIEGNTGMVLMQDNADWTLYPASLTKLMTLLLVFEALDSGRLTLQSPVYISARANKMPPSRLGVDVGETITVDQAIRALVTKSANNIAVAVAEKIAGSEENFALRMNLKAREIGMEHSHFVNASGLHNVGQYSSARDMARLGQYIYKNMPRYYPYFALKEFYFKGAVSQNHNHLMKEYQGMDGMKTGYITQSGFNLVASAKRNGVRLIGVVIGGKTASSRNAQMRQLLDKGFEKMRHVSVSDARGLTHQNQGQNQRPVLQKPEALAVAPPTAPDNTPITSALAGSGTWEIQLGAYQDRVSTDQAIYSAL